MRRGGKERRALSSTQENLRAIEYFLGVMSRDLRLSMEEKKRNETLHLQRTGRRDEGKKMTNEVSFL